MVHIYKALLTQVITTLWKFLANLISKGSQEARWKDGPCYQGDDGDPVETITDWHVGGMHKDALTKVAEKINRYPQYDSYTSKY